MKPAKRRELVREIRQAYKLNELRACGLIRITRWSNRYQSRRDPQTELRVRLRDLASTRIRYGYRRLTVMLRREGWHVNTKRVYRLYREEGLELRMKKRAKRAAQARIRLAEASYPNQRWSMDFVSDRMVDGRWFRILTVVDQYTRECLLLGSRDATLGRWRGSPGIATWPCHLGTFILPKMRSSRLWQGWVGTKLGTVKIQRHSCRLRKRLQTHYSEPVARDAPVAQLDRASAF